MRPLSETVNAVRTSFWFVPSALAVLGALLAPAALAFDAWGIPYVGDSQGGGDRLLSTLAGSIITVTGVVFSLTIVTLHLASGQYGPRVMRSFMRDRGNQTVLGTFVATFVYCVVALLGDPRGAGLAAGIGVLLTGASVAALIYFIHHLAMTIQADKVVAHVATQLDEQVDRLFPADFEARPVPEPPAGAPVLRADRDGYILSFEQKRLLAAAEEARATLRILVWPGQFVLQGSPIAWMWPAAGEDAARNISIGAARTENDDIEFSIQQLAEMAIRALSPSINDPFTAMVCIDRLSGMYCRLATRSSQPVVRGSRGRIVVPRPSFRHMLEAGFGCIRQHVDTALTQARLLEALGRVAACCNSPRRRAAVREQALALMARVEAASHPASDMTRLQAAFSAVEGQLDVAAR